MDNSQPSTYAGTTIMLTDQGRIALAADALSAAGKSRNEKRRKALCEQTMNHLRAIVGDSGISSRIANARLRRG